MAFVHMSSALTLAVITMNLLVDISAASFIPKVNIVENSVSKSKSDLALTKILQNNAQENMLADTPWSQYPNDSPGFPFPHGELINLGSPSSENVPCAQILTTSQCVLQVPDDSTHKNIEARQFTFAFGLIKDQCSLTLKDCLGSYSTFVNYLFPPGGICNTVASVCCECNGCNRPSLPLYENSCAALFEHEKCSLCYGFRLEVAKGDKVILMNELVNDRVSSIFVVPGCELKIFQDPNFQGLAAMAQGVLDYLPMEWNDQISSYECDCPNDPLKTTAAPFLTSTFSSLPISISATTEQSTASTSTEKLYISSTTSTEPDTTFSTASTTDVSGDTTSTTSHTTSTTSHTTSTTSDSTSTTSDTTAFAGNTGTTLLTTSEKITESTMVETTTIAEERTTEFEDTNPVY